MQVVVLLFLLCVVWHQARTTMAMPVRSAYVGRPVTLQCSNADLNAAPVTWLHQPNELTVAKDVYANGELFNGHKDRCSVDTSTPGRYDLQIHSARANDSGIYTCKENGGFGAAYTTVLKVIGITSSQFTDFTTGMLTSALVSSTDNATGFDPSAHWWIFVVFCVVLLILCPLAFYAGYRCGRRGCHCQRTRNSTPEELAQVLTRRDDNRPRRRRTVSNRSFMDIGLFWVDIFKKEIGHRKLTNAISERDRDIFALTSKSAGFKQSVGELVQQIRKYAKGPIDAIVSPDSRGFAFGGPVAYKLGLPLIPVRKEGNLPGQVEQSESFVSKKGENRVLEIQSDVFSQEARINRVVLVDDELASGGNTIAAVNLLKKLGVDVVMCIYVQELEQFEGREHLTAAGIDNVHSLVQHGAA